MRGKLRCRLLAQAATSAGDHPSDRAHGSHTGGDRQHWQELPGAVCVTKPIAPAELWEALHQALVCARHVTPASPQHTTPEAPDGRSLRVLLAEDNAINQRLTVRLLEKRGHTVTVVQDGTEALAALRRQMFDVVLMDIQMPCMDGLETTRFGREQDTATRVPIVAMTAHAMQGDRERCLAAGMDGYVSKPLRPTELFEVIARLTAPAASTPETPAASEEEQDILDRQTSGNASLAMLSCYARSLSSSGRLPRASSGVTRSPDAPGLPALARAAHRLKGALGNISANNALAAVRRVETSARAGDVHAATKALARLENELARLTLSSPCALGMGKLRSLPSPTLA